MDLARKYRYQIFNSFSFKIIGFVLMTIDHVGAFMELFGPSDSNYELAVYILRVIGRLAWPMFALMLAEGLTHTSNKWKYLLRLGILAGGILLGESIAFAILEKTGLVGGLFEKAPPSPVTDLFLYALFIIALMDKRWDMKLLMAIPIGYAITSYGCCLYEDLYDVTVIWFPYYLRSGYHWFGLLMVVGFYFAPKIVMKMSEKLLPGIGASEEEFKESGYYRSMVNVISCLFLLIVVLLLWGVTYIVKGHGYTVNKSLNGSLESWSLISALLICMYNGRKGFFNKTWRWIEYLYFPAHIVLLFIIFFLIYAY